MGGRVFKNPDGTLKASRISIKEYEQLKEFYRHEFLDKAYNAFNGQQYAAHLKFETPKELTDKESHGDLDVLYTDINDGNCFNLREILKSYFQISENEMQERAKTNGNILHFLHKTEDNNFYQIDFIKVPYNAWESYKFYSNYSALGMLLGNVVRKFKIQYGLTGFKFKETDTIIGPCNKVFEFLQLDRNLYNELEQNPTKENLFKFIWSSPFATKEVFEASLATATHRKREANSPLWNEFFKWIQTQADKPNTKFPTTELDLHIYLRRIFGNEADLAIKKHLFELFWKDKEIQLKRNHFDFDDFLDLLKNTNGIDLKTHEIQKLYGQFRKEIPELFSLMKDEIKGRFENFKLRNNL